MKKLFKRLFTFAMVMTMLISGSTVAMAAEPDSNIETSNDSNISVTENTIATHATRAASKIFIQAAAYNQPQGRVCKYSEEAPCDGNLVVRVDVTGTAKIKVILKDGIFWSTLYEDTVTDGTSWKISNGIVEQGWIVEVQITPQSTTAHFEIASWIEY